MHPMPIAVSLLHGTVLFVIAFFVWFAASRSTGRLKLLGNILGAWLVFAAIAGLVLAIFAPAMGWHGHHMHDWSAPAAAAPSNTAP